MLFKRCYIVFILQLLKVIINKVKLYVPQESTGLTGSLGQLFVGYIECKFVLHTNCPRREG